LTLAAALRDGWPVELVDLDHIWRQSTGCFNTFRELATDRIAASAPDILGFSSISGSYPATIRLAESCSRRLPGTPIVLGGPQASVVDTPTLEAFPFIDYVLRGEADESFPAMLTALERGEQPGTVPGLTFRDGWRIRRNPNSPAVLDLDRRPLPAFDLLAGIDDLGSLPLEAGRGCPFACTFCSTNDFFRRRFRMKPARRLLEEMRLLNTRYKVTTFDLVHDMFTVDRRKVSEFCDVMIEAGSPFRWSCSARTDCVDRNLLLRMWDAGCYDIFFGIETGSQRMQRVIDKNLDLAASRRILHDANEIGLLTTASLIVGYPEETAEDFRDTARFFSDMMRLPNILPQFNILSPLAATPVTSQYWDELFLDEDWTSISENGLEQDAVDQLLIAVHKDVFPNFYALPCHRGRSFVRRVRDFLVHGAVRCSGLMQALYLQTGDLLQVFELWEAAHGERSTAWYRSDAFIDALVAFSETEYSDRDVAVAVTARFYKAALEAKNRPRPVIPRYPREPLLALRPGVHLVTCKGDINAVFKALHDQVQPDSQVMDREVTVAVRSCDFNRSEILEFPPVSLDVLRHAEGNSAIGAVIRDFENREVHIHDFTPAQIVHGIVALLEKKSIVKTLLPDAAVPLASGAGA